MTYSNFDIDKKKLHIIDKHKHIDIKYYYVFKTPESIFPTLLSP